MHYQWFTKFVELSQSNAEVNNILARLLDIVEINLDNFDYAAHHSAVQIMEFISAAMERKFVHNYSNLKVVTGNLTKVTYVLVQNNQYNLNSLRTMIAEIYKLAAKVDKDQSDKFLDIHRRTSLHLTRVILGDPLYPEVGHNEYDTYIPLPETLSAAYKHLKTVRDEDRYNVNHLIIKYVELGLKLNQHALINS